VKWLEISVLTSAEAADAVGAVLLEARPGYAEEKTPEGVRLSVYLPDGQGARAYVAALRWRVTGVADYGLDPGPAKIAIRQRDESEWADAWKEHFTPFSVGRFRICPPWERTKVADGEILLVLNPGMAFGTGLHESTRLCLLALSAAIRGGETVLDVGTGSGILAIAAAKLGAARVLALDDDPVACGVARDNVAANDCGDRVDVRESFLFAAADGVVADVLVMNIIASVIADALPAVPEHLAPNGTVILSGIVEEGLPAMREAAASAGLAERDFLYEHEWRCLALGRL